MALVINVWRVLTKSDFNLLGYKVNTSLKLKILKVFEFLGQELYCLDVFCFSALKKKKSIFYHSVNNC